MAQDSQESFGNSHTFCSSCGKDMPQDALYCPHCGQRATAGRSFCSHCGESIDASVLFCPSCGSAVGAEARQTSGLGLAVQAEVEYMGFWVRLVAWIIDAVVVSVAATVLGWLGLGVFAFFSGWVYGILFIGLLGQTPGKMALGIKVVDAQGKVPGIGRAILREIVGKFVSAIVILLGYLWVGWDPRKRGWHDHIAGTYAVRAPRKW